MKKGLVTALSLLLGATGGAVVSKVVFGKEIEKQSGKVDKFKGYYNLLNQWLINIHEGKSIVDYLKKNDYKKIAIYGMGELGNRLYEELKNSDITVEYAIDKEANRVYSELEVVSIEDELKEVDMIIVTAIFAFEDIVKNLEEHCNYKVISLEDVIYDI